MKTTEIKITQKSFKDAAEEFLELHHELTVGNEEYDETEEIRLENSYLDAIEPMVQDSFFKLYVTGQDTYDRTGRFTLESLYALGAKKLLYDMRHNFEDDFDTDSGWYWESYREYLYGLRNIVSFLEYKGDKEEGSVQND